MLSRTPLRMVILHRVLDKIAVMHINDYRELRTQMMVIIIWIRYLVCQDPKNPMRERHHGDSSNLLTQRRSEIATDA